MNRQQRRRLAKKSPEYREMIQKMTEQAMKMYKESKEQEWSEHDDNFNDGDSGEVDNGDDDIYNI